MPSRSRALSALLLLCGGGIVAWIIIQPPHEKMSILGSTFGLLSILFGAHLLGEQDSSFAPTLSRPWLRYLPLIIGASVSLSANLASPTISLFALAAALTLLFPLSKVINVSKVYVAFLAVFLAASIGYNVFYYYPLIIGPDPMGYLSVASAIIQTGHFSDVIQPTDKYYFPFPVMSIAPSILCAVSGLDLQLSLLFFPGSLILLQPLLVFLVSRLVFDDAEAAALSAFIVVTESTVTQWVNAPIAQSTAISLLLLLLIVFFRRVRSRGYTVVAFVVFVILVALHGAVGLVSIVLITYLIIRKRSSYRGMIRPLVSIFLGYLIITGAIDAMVYRARWNLENLLEFIFTPTLRTGSELYGAGSNGVIFIWWGLPVSLALFCILAKRTRQESPWAYAGLGLLALSFAVNVIAPNLAIDRYGGLTAWLILAVPGGKALSALTRNSRQLLVLMPIMLLVCLSGVVNPSLSPQYGYQGYQGLLPTTKADRTALDWVDSHNITSVIGDSWSMRYLTFTRYQSGVLSNHGIKILSSDNIQRLFQAIIYSTRGPNDALFVRWSDTFLTRDGGQPCLGLTSVLANQQRDQIVNIIYNNSCDVLEAN